MNIILVGQKNGETRNLQLSPAVLISAVAGALLLMVLAVWGAIALFAVLSGHYKSGSSIDAEIISGWHQKLEQQSRMVAEAKASSARKIDAITLRMGELQARLLRLDALGERITDEAHLDASEFDFNSKPALGGPELASTEKSYREDDVTRELSRIENQIEDREKQLQILESLFVNQSMQSNAFIAGRPIRHGWLSSHFGWRIDPFTGKRGWHPGMDFAGKLGTKIIAVASGVVTWASGRSGYGNMVEIAHGSGLSTRYGHAEKILVKVGDVVKKGQVIALMGSTGRSTGPHVHFEVLKNEVQVNPEKFILRASR
jgi:murein DD-endopeptidase MepM/ murein hydrolase activator NlpD